MINQPRGSYPLNPGPNQRNALSTKEKPVVPVLQRPEHNPESIKGTINWFQCYVD